MEGDNGNGDARTKPGDIFAAILKVMDDISPIAKARTNDAQRYKFRGIDDIYNEIHPILCKHGVFIVPFVVESNRQEREINRDGGKAGVLFYTIATVDHRFYAADGSYITARTIGEAMDAGDKSGNKAMSAAMKYACIETFAIPTEGDNDSENGDPPASTPKRQQPTARPQQQAATADAGELASKQQIDRVIKLFEGRDDYEPLTNKWFAKARITRWEDMKATSIAGCIKYLEQQAAEKKKTPPQKSAPARRR